MVNPVGRPRAVNGPSDVTMDLTIVQPGTVPTSNRSFRWMFTLNNYTQDEYDLFVNRLSSFNEITYYVVGKEVAPTTGTRHLQGFFVCSTRPTFQRVVRMFGITRNGRQVVHFQISTCRNPQDAADYCKKDGDFVENGALEIPVAPTRSVDRNAEFNNIVTCIRDGTITTYNEILDRVPLLCSRHRNTFNELLRRHRQIRAPAELFPLKIWQADLYQQLVLAPDSRKIIFVVDPVGNSGKSWFSRYYKYLHPDNTQEIPIMSRESDMAFSLSETTRVLFIDIQRACTRIPYTFMESVKNGVVPCGKYDKGVLQMNTETHVVCLMNSRPNEYALSADRYVIIELDDRNNSLPIRVQTVNDVPPVAPERMDSLIEAAENEFEAEEIIPDVVRSDNSIIDLTDDEEDYGINTQETN